jgi:hypothetical protein
MGYFRCSRAFEPVIFSNKQKGVAMLIKKREIINYVRAIENPPEDIEFESCTCIYDLGLNKQLMQVHFETLRISDRPCPEYLEYQHQAQRIQSQYQNDQVKLRDELNKLASSAEISLKKEADRRKCFEDELEKEVDLPLKTIKAVAIKGKGKSLIVFLSVIQPVLVYDTGEAVNESPEVK